MSRRKKQRRNSKKQRRNRKAVAKPASEIEKTAADKDFPDDNKDHLSELPDDILVRILSLIPYKHAVQTASVSRRWARLVAQLPDLIFHLPLYDEFTTSSRATPSERRVKSMARTLHRRCQHRSSHAVNKLRLFFRKDVAMECQYADEFIALANATKLALRLHCARGSFPDEDAGAWSLQLPPATTELRVQTWWYAVKPPHIHGSAVNTLRSLTLVGHMVLRCQEFLVAAVLPALEDLHIGKCTLAVGIDITSRAMPRLKHLRIADVSVMTDETKAAVNVLVDELTTLRMSCHFCSLTKPPTEREMFNNRSRYRARFTTYSCFRLRAPKLRVFDWSCCYTDEVRVESVGRLSDAVVEVTAGRMPTPVGEESKYVTVQQRDKLMTDILQGLMPGLQPRGWEDVKSVALLGDTAAGDCPPTTDISQLLEPISSLNLLPSEAIRVRTRD